MKQKLAVMFWLLSTVGLLAQTTQQPLLVTQIKGITSSWPGESTGCPGTVINLSAVSRQNTYHAVTAVGTGSWAVTLRYSNVACTGPWTAYSGTASIDQSSNPATGFAIDPYNAPARYVNIVVTGNAVVAYSAQKMLGLSTTTGSVNFPCTIEQGCTGATDVVTAKDADHLNIPFLVSGDFDFAAQSPGGSLVAGGIDQAIVMAPCPFGIAGYFTLSSVLLSGGTGTAEATKINGGSCTPDAPSGTILVTPLYNHTGAWTVRSATSGGQEAVNSLPVSGGEVHYDCGVQPLYGTLAIGDGVVFVSSTRQNVRIKGCGAGGGGNFAAATDLVWHGLSGGTMVKFYGPVQGGGLTDLRMDGNSLASFHIDLYATSYARFTDLALIAGKADAIAARLDAGGDFNANTRGNLFQDVLINQTVSGSSGVQIGPTALDFNAGNFANRFINVSIFYPNDTTGSFAFWLGWADNNDFISCFTQPWLSPGLGSGAKHVRQPAGSDGYDFLPSENIFIHTNLGNPAGALGPVGDSGRGIGTLYWPYQVFDGGGIPNAKNHRGWLGTGDFFDSSRHMNFQNALRVYNRDNIASLSVSSFAYFSATGTVTITGTAILGSGTVFDDDGSGPGTGELAVGRLVTNGFAEFRRITAIADNTHATIDSAFTDDSSAGSRMGYALGINSEWWTDSSLHFGNWDDAPVDLFSSGSSARLRVASGGVTASVRLVGTGASSAVSNAGSNTITAAQLINGRWKRAGGGAQTDTTATAAEIVAAIPNCQVGQFFEFVIYNNSGAQHTLGLGTGVAADSGLTPTLTTPTLNGHRFTFRVTNVTPSSEAVVVLSDGFGPY